MTLSSFVPSLPDLNPEKQESSTLTLRIYLEDVDSQGFVYHANYLKFFERGRTEFMRQKGFDLWRYVKDNKTFFVVRHCHLDFQKPVFLDDEVTLHTYLVSGTGARLQFHQVLKKEQGPLVTMTSVLAHVTRDGTPKRLPEKVRSLLPAPSSPSLLSPQQDSTQRK